MIKRIYYIFLVLLAIAALIIFFEQSPASVLKYYSNGLYLGIGSVLRAFSVILPFAAGDVLYILIVLLTLRSLFLFFRRLFKRKLSKQQLWAAPFRLSCWLLTFFIAFKLLWGLNYSRPQINIQLGITDDKYTVDELTQLAGFFIQKINTVKPDRTVYYSIYKVEKEAVNSYQQLEKVNRLFIYPNPSVKNALNSWAVTRIGLEGYYNPFTGEANVNRLLPQFELPFTTCHEIAHQLGVAREDEANLVAYLTASNSKDVNFRYSAYYNVLRSILFELSFKSPLKFRKIYELLPAQVIADLRFEREFWNKHNNQMFDYMDAALDNYLKLNKQEQGIKSYQNIVLWVYNFHKEELAEMYK